MARTVKPRRFSEATSSSKPITMRPPSIAPGSVRPWSTEVRSNYARSMTQCPTGNPKTRSRQQAIPMPVDVAHPSGELVDHLFRNRAGQMVSHLTRLLGPEHLDLAEEAVQEALLKALQLWPYSGIPENPAGWLFRVARNAALDTVRHQALTMEKEPAVTAEILRAALPSVSDDADLEEQLRDDELRMILMCCDPSVSEDARVALSLKTVGGFSVREIARAFLA